MRLGKGAHTTTMIVDGVVKSVNVPHDKHKAKKGRPKKIKEDVVEERKSAELQAVRSVNLN
jgi:hypothetical protein